MVNLCSLENWRPYHERILTPDFSGSSTVHRKQLNQVLVDWLTHLIPEGIGPQKVTLTEKALPNAGGKGAGKDPESIHESSSCQGFKILQSLDLK
jgi:hypothetical protein